MKKIPSLVLAGIAFLLLATAIALAEYAMRSAYEIPDALFFGIPLTGVVISIIAISRAKPLQEKQAVLLLGIAVVLTVVPMVFLISRYHGDFDPLAERLAPDGSPVTSVSWNEEDGKYVERINYKFARELSESEYRAITIDHQRNLLGVLVIFSGLAFWTSMANVVIERGRR